MLLSFHKREALLLLKQSAVHSCFEESVVQSLSCCTSRGKVACLFNNWMEVEGA
jgi:hypothetical protein